MKKLENRGWLEHCEKLSFVLLCVLMAASLVPAEPS